MKINVIIDNALFYNFIFTQLFFYLGFCINKSVKTLFGEVRTELNIDNQYFFKRFVVASYLVFNFVFAISACSFYYKVGIPLFSDGLRQDLYHQASYLHRITTALCPIIYFLAIHILYKKYRFFLYRLIILINIGFILFWQTTSGSRTAVALTLICVLFYYWLYIYKNPKINRKIIIKIKKIVSKLIFVGFFVVLFLIGYTTSSKNLLESINNFFIRIIAFGDIYAYYYYPGNINYIPYTADVFIMFFGFILSNLHIIPVSNKPIHPGSAVWLAMGFNTIAGPNARFNVFGYLLFGNIGSIIYSFCIGYIISKVRYKLYKKVPNNVIGGLLYMLLFRNTLILENDFFTAQANFITDFMVIIPVFTGVYLFLSLTTRIKKINGC